MSRQGQTPIVRCVFMAALLAAAAGPWAGHARAAEQQPLPFLMAEDFEDLDFCAWRIEPGEPDPHNPLVEPAMPWDDGGVLAHGSVKRDPIDGLWKAWQVSLPRPTTKPGTQDPSWWRPALTYLESKDGVSWQRPKLKLVPWKGHRETNLLTDGYTTYASVNIDPGRKDAPYEMFAFRMPGFIGAHVRGGPKVIEGLPLPPGKDTHPYGVYRFRSRDGKAWRAVEGPLILETADSCNIYRLADGTYVSYHKTEMPAVTGAHGGYTEGAATTRRADLAGKQLVVNARTRPSGTLRVELLDRDGRTLPGFAAADCEPVAGDHHALAVRWKGGDRAPADAARARFLFRRAFLYGLAWQ